MFIQCSAVFIFTLHVSALTAASETSVATLAPIQQTSSQSVPVAAQRATQPDEAYLQVVPYGFLLPSFGAASGPVASFGQLNQQAITAAYPRDRAMSPDSWRTRFAVSQSRAGLELRLGQDGQGLVEFDAINFALAAPTVMTRPRLRRAFVSYRPSEHVTVMMGQDWDIFSPLNPFTHNFVGNLFQGGNAGFMRLQARAAYARGPVSAIFAIGAPGFNNQASEGALELTAVPLGELQLALLLPRGTGRIGVAGMAGAYAYARSATSVARRPVGGANVFFALTPLRWLEANIEAYWGQNIGDTGTLTLSQGGIGHENYDVQEAGGFVSLRARPTKRMKVYGSYGLAQITRGQSELTVFSDETSANGTLSLLRNEVMGAGLSIALAQNFEVYGEYGFYRSRYKELVSQPSSGAHRIEVGLMLNFPPRA